MTARPAAPRQEAGAAHKRLPDATVASVLRSDDRADKIAKHADIDASTVRCAIETLPRLREILVLREIDELSYREISEVTSLPTGEVMSRSARGASLPARSGTRIKVQLYQYLN